ncbi:MAG: GGDEF domain-containing protein [Synergistaceae bacterium]|nr:GGDEF domain-containing protein [Synergistaceae bacterium]
MSIWSKVLDNCPGLLCCVVNLQGKLIYATHGYKVVAARIFGHQCEEGGTYPPLITELDKILHGALTSAGLGKIDAFEVAGQPKNWEVVTSPLRIEPDKIAGVVIKLLQVDRQDAENTSAPVIISNPDILEAVPFRAGVVDTHGMFLAANKYLASCVRSELQGKNIFELIKPEVEADVVNIILRRTGNFECLMYDINISENFYDEVAMTYLDDELNDEITAEKGNLRRMKIHASPITWNAKDCTMLTFEDITDYVRTHDQLRRLLTFDASTGILNRRGIEQIISSEIGRVIKSSGQMSLIMINIDKFTGFNKNKGYMSGTRTIRNVVNNIKSFLKDKMKCVISRWQGDELLILAYCSGARAVVIADDIRENSDGIELSAGVSDLTDGGYVSTSEFIGAAYDALTLAKTSGGNRTVLAGNS